MEIEKTIENMQRKLKIARNELANDPIPCNDTQILIKKIHTNNVTSLENVIKILREKQECERGCEWCNGNALDSLVIFKDIAGNYRIALHGGNAPIDKSEKPKYCPKCGRKLGENDG